MSRIARACALFALLAACADPPPKAPEEMDDLTRFLFREWGHEDPTVLEDGVAKLEASLAGADLKGELFFRSFELNSPSKDDLAHIDPPKDRDPATTIGMAIARESRWPVTDHGKLQASNNLLAAEPTATKYVRTFENPSDPKCFHDRSCLVVTSDNAITRSNLLMTVSFDLAKDFRWVRLPGDRWAIVARSWTNRVWPGEDPDTSINQTYALDVWLGQANGTTWRYQALYQDAEVGVSDRELIITTVTSSTDDMFETTDDVIGERFHGE